MVSASVPNDTSFHPSTFILLGIPGMRDQHIWAAIPCSMYILALVGNGTILYIIVKERTPARANVPLPVPGCSSLTWYFVQPLCPKMLTLFWLKSHRISYQGCLTQMFFCAYQSLPQNQLFCWPWLLTATWLSAVHLAMHPSSTPW